MPVGQKGQWVPTCCGWTLVGSELSLRTPASPLQRSPRRPERCGDSWAKTRRRWGRRAKWLKLLLTISYVTFTLVLGRLQTVEQCFHIITLNQKQNDLCAICINLTFYVFLLPGSLIASGVGIKGRRGQEAVWQSQAGVQRERWRIGL